MEKFTAALMDRALGDSELLAGGLMICGSCNLLTKSEALIRDEKALSSSCLIAGAMACAANMFSRVVGRRSQWSPSPSFGDSVAWLTKLRFSQHRSINCRQTSISVLTSTHNRFTDPTNTLLL